MFPEYSPCHVYGRSTSSEVGENIRYTRERKYQSEWYFWLLGLLEPSSWLKDIPQHLSQDHKISGLQNLNKYWAHNHCRSVRPWAVGESRITGPYSPVLIFTSVLQAPFLWRIGEEDPWEDCSTGIDGFDVRGEGIPSSGRVVQRVRTYYRMACET